MGKDIYIGVDLGGTKIMASPLRLGRNLKILGKAKNPTRSKSGYKTVVKDIILTIKQSIENAKINSRHIKAVGIGAPGAVDVKRNIILKAPNLGWENIKINKLIEKELNIPVYLDNDVNLGVLGEQQYGAARNSKDVVGVFWGTGIGGGLVLNGKIYHGYSFTAGEIGHMVISSDGKLCNCGNRGCLESYAGKWAISRDWFEYHNKTDKKPGKYALLKSKMIKKTFADNDPFMTELINNACNMIGITLASVVNLLNPQTIVLGGGMIESMNEELTPLIISAMNQHIFKSAKVEIKTAELGDFSVLTGAGVYARQRTN
ncbi:MAG: ROK family protein [Calditrichaceae bacterium]|nr:ROK family protein [Calditrichaceae bacterium]